MNQVKLKILLENLIYEIEANNYLTVNEIVNKLTTEIQSHQLINEVN